MICEPSTHITRDRSSGDERLEILLEEWGLFRAKGLKALSSGMQSSIVSISERAAIKYKGNREIKTKETRTIIRVVPNYMPHRRMSNVNKCLLGINELYYKILIYKYEHGWMILDFTINWGWDRAKVSDKLRHSRKSARKELEKTGLLKK